MTRYNFLFISFSSLFWACQQPQNPPSTATVAVASTPQNIRIEIIPAANNTFGYDIFVDNKKVIHQPHKPVVSGTEGFKSREQAERVAELVGQKIKRGEMPPSVSLAEMTALNAL